MTIKENRWVVVVPIVLLLLGVTFISFQKNKTAPFPPAGVNCFDEFTRSVQSGYADPEMNLPAFEIKNVSYFRCASQKGFEQYEVAGTDNIGHSFYVHHSGGGMAASGADAYLNHCYKKDGTIIKNIRLIGRDPVPQEGSCAFEEAFPMSPDSKYRFGIL